MQWLPNWSVYRRRAMAQQRRLQTCLVQVCRNGLNAGYLIDHVLLYVAKYRKIPQNTTLGVSVSVLDGVFEHGCFFACM
jgi:hypothetical protein